MDKKESKDMKKTQKRKGRPPKKVLSVIKRDAYDHSHEIDNLRQTREGIQVKQESTNPDEDHLGCESQSSQVHQHFQISKSEGES